MLTTEQYVKQCLLAHNNFYSYEKTIYTGKAHKVIVTCPKHGDYSVNADTHLRLKVNCRSCSLENRTETTGSFIERAIAKHGNFYDYSKVDYVGSKLPVIVTCKIHGDFSIKPKNHLYKHGCPLCGHIKSGVVNLKSFEDFYNSAITLHGDKYQYVSSSYIGFMLPMTIICPVHGEFQQIPKRHLETHGCAECTSELGKLNGWSRSNYIKIANGRPVHFYIIRCFNDDESFYKVGITLSTVKQRYDSKIKMPYNYEIIVDILLDVAVAWDFELLCKQYIRANLYKPLIAFNGSARECYQTNFNNVFRYC